MDELLPAYEDPLFSIIIFVALALIIAVVSYGWGVYKHQKEHARLVTFLDRFEAHAAPLDTASLRYEEGLFEPLSLLAHAFETSGQYPRAIGLYRYLIQVSRNDSAVDALMERLGRLYVRIGMLERAEDLLLEVLRRHPRRKQALVSLGVVYEHRRQYDRARETLEPLSLLGEDTAMLMSHLEYLALRHTPPASIEEAIARRMHLLERAPRLYRPILSDLFELDASLAWRHVDTTRLDEIIDLLWGLPVSQLDLDIISQDTTLHALYIARGVIQGEAKRCGHFGIDMLTTARAGGYDRGELYFGYLCSHCKQSFPIHFIRCPNCMAIATVIVEVSLGSVEAQSGETLL